MSEQSPLEGMSPEQREKLLRDAHEVIKPFLRREKNKNQESLSSPELTKEMQAFFDWLDLDSTQASQQPRFDQPYQINLKSDLEVKDAHPETINQTFPQSQAILDKLNQQHPRLNLQGLTLPEYLLFQAYTYYQAKQQDPQADLHPETVDWTWLLGEQVLENNQAARCLDAYWDSDFRLVRVNSRSSSRSHSIGGARFAAVPRSA